MTNLKKSRNNRTGKFTDRPGSNATREHTPLPGHGGDASVTKRDATTGKFVSQPLRRAGAGEVRRSASRMKERFSGALANLKDR